MKTLITMLTILLLALLWYNESYASTHKPKPKPRHITFPIKSCNQAVYDQVYKAIIQECLTSNAMEELAIFTKLNKISILRELCNGQRSTYEKGS